MSVSTYSNFTKLAFKTGLAVGAQGSETDLWTSSESLGTSAASKLLGLNANQELNGVGVLKSADTLIATAAVKTLNASPVEVVPAPGAGYYVEFVGAYVFLDYATTAYSAPASGADLAFKYTDGSGDVVSGTLETTGFINASADALAIVGKVNAEAIGVANAKIVLHNLSSTEYAAGDSPLKVRVLYRLIRTASLEAIA